MERMRHQLAERDARMQQMLAGIAHEVRNPLAGMTLFAGILQRRAPDGDERRGHVERSSASSATSSASSTTSSSTRAAPPELATVDVADLLAEVAQIARHGRRHRGQPSRPAARAGRADRAQLRRALLNLARNAVQAAAAAEHRGKGAVTLSRARGRRRIWLAVWNRGKEIPAETSGKLFEPFYTTREKGTGPGPRVRARHRASITAARVELDAARTARPTFSCLAAVVRGA